MNKLFDLNSPVMQALARLVDFLMLSLLWFVCCLPVFTIGPATAAMYYVALKLARKDEVKIADAFFRGFKMNFKQGVIFSFLFLVIGAILFVDYLSMAGGSGLGNTLVCGMYLALGVWTLCIMVYTYALQAQFENPFFRTLKNAMFLSTRQLSTTVIVFVLNIIPVAVAFVSLQIFVLTLPIWILLAPGAIAYLCAKRFVKIFDPMINSGEIEE